jgi:hypothetical protein
LPQSLLDNLMGVERNLTAEEKEHMDKPPWEDENVCPYMLAGTCPFNLFSAPHHWRIGAKGRCTETCDKSHDRALQTDFKANADPSKVERCERQLLGLLQLIVDECNREVEIAQAKVAESEQSVDFLPNIRKNKERLAETTDTLSMFVEQAEAAAECGCVDLAQESMHEVERIVNEKSRLEGLLQSEEEHYRERYATQRVCTICGSVTNPNDETTETRHMNGNRHNGWVEVRQVLSDLRSKYGEETAKKVAEAENARKGPGAQAANESMPAKTQEENGAAGGEEVKERGSSKSRTSANKSRSKSSHHAERERDRDKGSRRRKSRSRSRSRSKREKHKR